jgi:hypothetical protein
MFFSQTLESSHVNTWADLWRGGRIDITGNNNLATLAYSCLYYILSSLPLEESPDFVGLSPGDLAHGSGFQVQMTVLYMYEMYLLLI